MTSKLWFQLLNKLVGKLQLVENDDWACYHVRWMKLINSRVGDLALDSVIVPADASVEAFI